MKNILKRVLGALVAGMVIVSPLSAVAPAITAYADKTLTASPSHTQEVGWYNDYHHEIWQADTPNSSTMTLHDNDGGFGASWKCGPNGSRGNFIAHRGIYWGLNNPNTYKDYRALYCDYDCIWYSGSAGNAMIGIYGWAQNPLVEYYIIEDWKNWSPAQDPSAQYKGSVTIDGSQYKIYKCVRNAYTIEGNTKPFTQYISIRQNTRTKGTVNVLDHFKAWENLGMKMGNLYECVFDIEGWESDGMADVTMNMSAIGGGYHHPEDHTVQNVNMEYNSQYKQMRFTWDAVNGADSYGVAVYLAGKWRVQEENITDTEYTTPKNLTLGKTYKVAIAARVNGKLDTANAIKNAVTFTVK